MRDAPARVRRARYEETRRCKGGGPSRIRQMGERPPKRRQEDGRLRVLRILRERKARSSRFPCRGQQMANRSPLASSRRSIERLTPRKFCEKILAAKKIYCVMKIPRPLRTHYLER